MGFSKIVHVKKTVTVTSLGHNVSKYNIWWNLLLKNNSHKKKSNNFVKAMRSLTCVIRKQNNFLFLFFARQGVTNACLHFVLCVTNFLPCRGLSFPFGLYLSLPFTMHSTNFNFTLALFGPIFFESTNFSRNNQCSFFWTRFQTAQSHFSFILQLFARLLIFVTLHAAIYRALVFSFPHNYVSPPICRCKRYTAMKTTSTKPSYSVMVAETLKTLGNRSPNSMHAISKEISHKYDFDINKQALSKAIKKGVQSGDFIQVKSSYKLSKTAPPTKKKVSKTSDSKKSVPKSSKMVVTKSKKTTTKTSKVRCLSQFVTHEMGTETFRTFQSGSFNFPKKITTGDNTNF